MSKNFLLERRHGKAIACFKPRLKTIDLEDEQMGLLIVFIGVASMEATLYCYCACFVID
jgi:hypothetical protein